MVSYPPEIDRDQAELVNGFLQKGGAIALGVLPNTDSPYELPVLEVFRKHLANTLRLFGESGVDLALLEQNTMVSTQCGLSGASAGISKRIHTEDHKYPEIVKEVFKQ